MKRFVVVALVVVTGMVGTSAVRSEPIPTPWHLDRINQAALPLDDDVSMGPLTGAGIDIYVVDSGTRSTHEQFGGRVLAGTDVSPEPVDPPTGDCDGHGTHVSALAAGSTVGVATQARIVAVRVLDCNGEGDVSDVVKALRWIRAHHRSGTAAIVNLSLGVDIGDDGAAIEAEVHRMVDEGIVTVVAAGNGNGAQNPLNACDISPGRLPEVLTVGASTATDGAASYSNYGPCVDLYAPGGDRIRQVWSAWIDNDSDYNTEIGTSMAAPLVSGYAALLAQQQPSLCPMQIESTVVARATVNALTGLTPDTANRLLRIDTAPVAPTVPGMASNVVVSTSKGNLTATWDPPCDGASPLTSTIVSVKLGSRTIKRLTVAPGVTKAVFSRLRTGVSYRVVVKSANGLGAGTATARIAAPPVHGYWARGTYSVSALARLGEPGLSMRWKVSKVSKSVCRMVSTSRIRFVTAGVCRVELRMVTGGAPIIRKFTVR